MGHGSDSTYETLINQRRIYDSTRPSGCPANPSGQVSAGEVLRGRHLFPKLVDKPIALMAAQGDDTPVERTQKALEAISSRMLGPRDPDDGSETPAAYTYFGQFAFHDIVFSRVFGAAGASGKHSVDNAVTVGLDLSGLYGRGPTVDAHLYDAASAIDTTPCRFPMGLPAVADPTVIRAVDPGGRGRDLPRVDAGGAFLAVCGRKSPYRPLVADPRNDDNLILSQLLCALMQAHNRLVDLQIRDQGATPLDAFERARAFLTSVYRRVVVDDYMRRILSPAVWEHFFGGPDFRGPGFARLKPLSDLPLEFSFGASRFAHGMVRNRYRINQSFDENPGTLRQILSFSSQRSNGDVPVRENWIVDWSRFVGGDAQVQNARRIGPFLALELATVTHTSDLDGTPRSIAFMDCWRCYHLGLPSGQTVAKAVGEALAATGLGVPVLTGPDILPSAKCVARHGYVAKELVKILQAYPEFLAETPLSYYVLQEASVLGDDGNRLGPVGSYIVGATVASALFKTDENEMRAGSLSLAVEPNDLPGLIRMADDRLVTDEQLAGYLDRFVHPARSARVHRRTGDIAS